MAEVLAVVVGGERQAEVAGAARALAALVRGGVRELDLPGGAADETARAVVEALDDPEVALAVLAAEPGVEGASWLVMGQVAKPLVLLPLAARASQPPIGRVLVPLDGSAECGHAVEHTIELCADAGVDLVVLHVFGPGTTPPFWDQSAHALRA